MVNDRQIYTVQVRLARALTGNPTALRAAKDDLNRRLDWYVASHGYTVVRVIPATVPPSGPEDDVVLRLEAELIPRTDGEWPAIRQALEEDEADRVAAKAARAADPVHGRLDALKDAADVWGDRGLRGLPWPLDGSESPVSDRLSPRLVTGTTDSVDRCDCWDWCDQCDGCS